MSVLASGLVVVIILTFKNGRRLRKRNDKKHYDPVREEE